MPREFLHESVRDSMISQSKDGNHRVWGGFYYVGPDLIRFDKVEEVADETDGEEEVWREYNEASSCMNVLEAQMLRVELEEVIRHASHPWNKEWRLVQLRWEPAIIICPEITTSIRVGVDGACMLLKQLEKAIIDAEMMEGYQERAREDEAIMREWDACQN